ncbi:MAG: serine/threonine-protein kinase [Isosphaeraceae bacterium]
MPIIEEDPLAAGTAGEDSSGSADGGSLMESFLQLVRSGSTGVESTGHPPRNAPVPRSLADCIEEWPVGVPRPGRASEWGDLGGFRVIREVGRGGMGVVYEAEQTALGRRVALKVLPPAASLDPRHRHRFEIEAQAAALLHHENIVSVLAFGSDHGVDFFAMPFIDGCSLSELIRDRRGRGPLEVEAAPTLAPCIPAGGLDYLRAAARLGLQAAEALDHAHSVGVIHRDVKPSNLLVDTRGHLWVTDFGLARIGEGDAALTRTGDILGTLRYMSPELLRGDRPGASPRSDVYALGATLYELLTLRPAFAGQDREELLRKVLQDEPVPPRRLNPQIPRDLETVVRKAMAKEPSSRYASAAEMAGDLRRFLDDRPVLARRPGPVERLARWSRRRRAVVVTAVSGLMCTLSVSTALLWSAKRQTDEALRLEQKARGQQALAFHLSLGTVDQIIRAQGDPRQVSQSPGVALGFYDRIVRAFAGDEAMQEVVAIALRSSGHLRLTQGQPAGHSNYRRSIKVYETIASRHPERVWLRTRLIETLKEYADLLRASGETEEAEGPFRHALAVADRLAADRKADAHCFARDLAPVFDDLARSLVRRPDTRPCDSDLAVCLARKAVEWEPGQPEYRSTLNAALARVQDQATVR